MEIANPLDYKRSAILFVDDEEKSLKYFSRVFSYDFRIITSTDVESASRLIDQQADEIAVLITDQRMPKQKGVDLLKYSREKYPHIVRLLTTAYTDLGDAIEAVNTGEIFRYITKPWDIDKLHDHLVDAMNLFLAREQERNLLVGKRQAMFQIAGNIAHELRTPLLSILAAAKGTANFMPSLVAAYKKNRLPEDDREPIRDSHLATLSDTLSDIIMESNNSLTIIDILLTKIKGVVIEPDAFALLSMRDCLNESLQRYPYRENQAQMITVSGHEDFQFKGVRQLMVHVFYNLIKNALYAIAVNGNKGLITISIRPGDKQNLVYFNDTGPGIDATVIPHIFDSFYSIRGNQSEGNIGIGLAFCKNVMAQFNAGIKCLSEPGLYTEFVMSFPAIAGNESK
ncbi:MAG: ATP-binding protein [Gammaproteobacteria bacterium]|nr:ATP-binding protein [Gammaproteobacteria bacterium]